VLNVHTGLLDLSQFGKIQKVDYASENDKYSGRCGNFFGTTGEFYGFHKSREEVIGLFAPNMCRTMEFDYEKDIEVHGLKAYKYGGDRVIDNGTKYNDRACYSEGFMPSGIMNISKCRYNSPVSMSLPHYLYGDPFYGDQVEGLNPIKEKHEFFVGLEPTTGIPIKVASRLQANVLFRNDPGVTLFKDIKDTIIPAMWVEYEVTVHEGKVADLKMAVMMASMGRIVGIVLIAIGIILVIFIPVLNIFKKQFIPDENDAQEASTSRDKNSVSPLLQKQKTTEMSNN
jgi:scavenger receptor class B protein 1